MKRIQLSLLSIILLMPFSHAMAQTHDARPSLRHAMDSLAAAHGVNFVYDSQLPLGQPSPAIASGLPLSDALNRLFANTTIIYKVKGRQVLLIRRKNHTLSGYVRDAQGETLINATVYDQTTRQGTMTNEYGYYSLTLPAGEHRLTVWFPCLTAAVISNVTASDGASFRPASYSRRMICFGDSISQGYDALYPMLCYTNRLADHFDAYMLNLAIGGEKFVPGLLSREFAGAFRPDIITVAYGTNDWSGFDRDTFFRRCDGFLEKLAEYYPDSERFVITPLWRADRDRITKFGSFDEAVGYIADKAAACGHHVIDGYGFLPHYPGFFSDLRLHPNDLGYGEYVRGLVAAMEKVLDR